MPLKVTRPQGGDEAEGWLLSVCGRGPHTQDVGRNHRLRRCYTHVLSARPVAVHIILIRPQGGDEAALGLVIFSRGRPRPRDQMPSSCVRPHTQDVGRNHRLRR